MRRSSAVLLLSVIIAAQPSAAAQVAEIAAVGLAGPISLTEAAGGRVFVADSHGKLLELRDEDGDGRFERRQTRLDGVPGLSGVAADQGGLWLSAGDRLLWLSDAAAQPQVLSSELPPAAAEQRALGIGPDGRLYIGGRALLARFDPRDADLGIYATGLSATTGFGWHPETLGFWGVDGGQPGSAPAELNRLIIANNYGWRCDPCGDSTGAALILPLHPTAMVFLAGDSVTADLHGDAILAASGPEGDRLVRIDFDERGAPVAVLPFADEVQWGRIGGLALAADGSLLVADSGQGLIRRIGTF